jgi:hypothetical protein
MPPFCKNKKAGITLRQDPGLRERACNYVCNIQGDKVKNRGSNIQKAAIFIGIDS